MKSSDKKLVLILNIITDRMGKIYMVKSKEDYLEMETQDLQQLKTTIEDLKSKWFKKSQLNL